MQENQVDLLTESVLQINTIKRKTLLPWWIKVFMWIFLVCGAIVPFVLILGMFGYNVQLAIYGMETNDGISVTGLIIIFLLLIKTLTAYGLLKEKDWAIKAGIIDAVVGISICIILMSYSLINTEMNFTFRLEVIFLVPYLFKFLKIKAAWENSIEI